MTEQDYLPTKDSVLGMWTDNFVAVASDNAEILGLTTTQINALNTNKETFHTTDSAANAARMTAKTATATHKLSRKTLVGNLRAVVKQIQASPGVTDALKTQLGITVSSSRRPIVPVYQPTGLVAVVEPDLRVYLKWDKNGNQYGCLYNIERKAATDTMWTKIKSQTSTRFHDDTVTPGVQTVYRVTASRGLSESMPSPTASVY